MEDPHSSFNRQQEISLQKQLSANFGGAASMRDPNDSARNEESLRQAEKMNLQFGRLAGSNDIANDQMGIFGQPIG